MSISNFTSRWIRVALMMPDPSGQSAMKIWPKKGGLPNLFDVAVLAGVGVLLYHVWWYSSL